MKYKIALSVIFIFVFTITIFGGKYDEHIQRQEKGGLQSNKKADTVAAQSGPGTTGTGFRKYGIGHTIRGGGEDSGIVQKATIASKSGEQGTEVETANPGTAETSGLDLYPRNEENKGSSSVSEFLRGNSSRGNADNCNSLSTYKLLGRFKITAYHESECDKKPSHPEYGITYSGKQVRDGITIAADLDILPLGTKVKIDGLDGIRIVEDVGGAVNGKHVDVYMSDLDAVKAWGLQYRNVYIITEGGN